jgi:hypothetical protein
VVALRNPTNPAAELHGEGWNLAIERRFIDWNLYRLPEVAAELNLN